MPAITVQDVRDYLNGITEEELTSKTIEKQIEIAIEKASDLGIASDSTFVLKYAGWKSFLLSNLFTSIKIHDITVKADLKAKIASLKDAVDEELESIDGAVFDSTPMFDARPEDDSINNECWPE